MRRIPIRLLVLQSDKSSRFWISSGLNLSLRLSLSPFSPSLSLFLLLSVLFVCFSVVMVSFLFQFLPCVGGDRQNVADQRQHRRILQTDLTFHPRAAVHTQAISCLLSWPFSTFTALSEQLLHCCWVLLFLVFCLGGMMNWDHAITKR